MISNEDDWAEEPPCPSCGAFGDEPCASGCRERLCECGMCWRCDPSWQEVDV